VNGNDKKKCETNDKQMVLYNGTKKSIARHLISLLATICLSFACIKQMNE
jgi:hypothetical protein